MLGPNIPPSRRPVAGQRPRSYKTEAVVLRSISVREADRLVTVFTPSLGKLLLTVRGARRVTSRLGGHLDVFNRVNLNLAIGHQIDVVTGAEALESFGLVKGNLDAVASAMYLAETVDKLMPEASPHPELYTLVVNVLRILHLPDVSRRSLRYAELRLMEGAGYLPDLTNCQVCGIEVMEGNHSFAPGLGGVIDNECRLHGQILPLSIDAIKVLRHYCRSSLSDAVRVALPAHLENELESILGASLTYILEREIASSEFLNHLKRM